MVYLPDSTRRGNSLPVSMSFSPLRSLSLPSRIALNKIRFRVLSHPFQCDFISQIRFQRDFHSSRMTKDRSFTNLLAGDTPPAVHVSSISEKGIQLLDGLVIQGPCVFLEGKVFLWDVPGLDLTLRSSEEQWKGWTEEKFEVFKIVTPRPGGFIVSISSVLPNLKQIFGCCRNSSFRHWKASRTAPIRCAYMPSGYGYPA